MPKDGSKTKIRILDHTMALVLEHGFAGTTIDHILASTGMTKGAFFYHFKNKADLALRLMEHFERQDMDSLKAALDNSAQFSDPKKRLLEFVQIFIDMMCGLEDPYPGCLYASYIYEPEQFNQEIKDIVARSVLKWRADILQLLQSAGDHHEMRMEVDLVSLADHFSVILEGAFIISKALNDAKVTGNQLIHYRNYLDLLFIAKGQ